MMVGAYASGGWCRIALRERDQTKQHPGPPGWGLSAGLTTLPFQHHSSTLHDITPKYFQASTRSHKKTQTPNSRKCRITNMLTQSVLILTVPLHCTLMPAPYIPDIRLETYGRYYLYEIGFLTVAGGLSMAWFQWKLNLCIWCSGVWPMNCCGRTGVTLGALLWGWSGSGSEIRDHSDHGRSNELINFCPEWSHHCIWSTSLWASSLIWASETSLARTRERAAKPWGTLRSCILARLPLLAQIGELVRRLLIYRDPSDLGPLILIWVISKEPTLNLHDTRDQQTQNWSTYKPVRTETRNSY